MLKLLKYDLISSYRQFFATFAIFLFSCLATPFLPDYLKNISSGLLVTAVIGISFAVQINIALNYNKTLFKKPGYLTLTLPVSTHKIVLSKIISSIIWYGISIFVLFLGFTFILGTLNDTVTILDVLGSIFRTFGEMFKNFTFRDYMQLFLMISYSISGGVILVSSVFCVITFVHTKYVPKHKFVVGFLVYVGICVILTQVISHPFVESIYSIFLNSFTLTGQLITMIAVFFMGSILLYFLTVYFIDHKIEIE